MWMPAVRSMRHLETPDAPYDAEVFTSARISAGALKATQSLCEAVEEPFQVILSAVGHRLRQKHHGAALGRPVVYGSPDFERTDGLNLRSANRAAPDGTASHQTGVVSAARFLGAVDCHLGVYGLAANVPHAQPDAVFWQC